MILDYEDREIDFSPWAPAKGQIFQSTFAFRPGTAASDQARPWLPSTFVVGAAYDGDIGYLIARSDLEAFFAAHRQATVVLHDAAEGLDAIKVAAPGLDIYEWVDANRIGDTQILHRLLTLATEGHTDSEPDHLTLASIARSRLKIDWLDRLREPSGRRIDHGFGRYLNRPIDEIDPDRLVALISEAIVIHRLHDRLQRRIRRHLDRSVDRAWGYVSPAWLDEQVERWGLLTHHIQVKAAIVLRAISARGLHVDLEHRADFQTALREFLGEQKSILAPLGYLPGQPTSKKAAESILRRIERRTGVSLATTASGDISTSEESLASIVATEPFARAFLAYHAAERLLNNFLSKLDRPILHPSFDVIKTTGRTSSYGDFNAQNMPRDLRVRSCIVARPGFKLVSADYQGIELVALSQACLTQFGLDSRMAAEINAGKDLHVLVAAMATGQPEAEITPEQRQKAKPVNFGLPGAMSRDGLKAYALTSYGVDLADDEADSLTEAWFERFPEMREFLRNDTDVGLAVAEAFELTRAGYRAHTGSERFHRHLNGADEEHEPSSSLGWMFLRAIKIDEPTTNRGRTYESCEIDYFWTRLQARAQTIPQGFQDPVQGRRPSPKLCRAIMTLVDSAPVFTLTGRLRAAASFPARHNTIFQGLAADGAKLALWKVWRAGYPIVNFIHDEILGEVPDGPDTARDAREIRRLMITGMAEVIPDVRVEVKSTVSRSWGGEADPETGKHAAGSPDPTPVKAPSDRRQSPPGPAPIGSIYPDPPIAGVLHV